MGLSCRCDQVEEVPLTETDAYFSDGLESGNAVLLVHGFTGSPHSLLGVARYLESGGLKVALPQLPGHGTNIDDLLDKEFDDWYSSAASVATRLLDSCARVDLFGLSMGGSIVLKLLESFNGFGRAVLVNPLVEPPASSFLDLMKSILESGFAVAPGISSDVAKPDSLELGYNETPIKAALSLFDALPDIANNLGAIKNEILLFSSRQDHVVPKSSGELLVNSLRSARLRRVWLDRSFHVATLDYDAELISNLSLEFFRGPQGGV